MLQYKVFEWDCYDGKPDWSEISDWVNELTIGGDPIWFFDVPAANERAVLISNQNIESDEELKRLYNERPIT